MNFKRLQNWILASWRHTNSMKPHSWEMLLPGRTICLISLAVLALGFAEQLLGQGMSQGPPPPATAKTIKCKGRPVPQLEDITHQAGIRFEHDFSPEAHSILESMAGGVLLLDYDRDGWLDIYFTNAPTVEEALQGKKARGALYHNNHDGTFTDRNRESRRRQAVFCDGGSGRRLQQRRLARHLRDVLRRQRALSKQRRWHASPT